MGHLETFSTAGVMDPRRRLSFWNDLACNTFTKSELVVLIRRGEHILGQIDIDSDVPQGFGDSEHADVKEVADALAVLL